MSTKKLIEGLAQQFIAAQDPLVAAQQSAYMRNQFPFHGIKKPLRAHIQKIVFKEHPLETEKELIQSLERLWAMPEREYQFAALDLAYHYKRLWTPHMLVVCEKLIRTKSWWDTVDCIAPKLVGTLLGRYPDLLSTMDEWIDDEYMWIRRSALIYQLSYRQNTDKNRLFRYCQKRMGEKEFFIRKAIGWSLRQYARTNPLEVKRFIIKKKDALSPLSYREAGKYCLKEL